MIKEVGEAWVPEYEVRDHLTLAGDRIDMERGARLSGSRFAYLRGGLVRLELSLVSWVLDHLAEQGFEPVIPPVLVREEALYGTGFLPDTEQQIYKLADDDLYLAGTSEVALASLHAGEILDGETLPRRYAGFSPCFRREAGAAGKDTRGIFRVHQFDKVEMFSFVDPETSRDEHERLLAIEESILQALNIPYRVVNIAVDDLGASAAKKYDCEAWLPSQQRYRELTSTSNTTDYQARRLDIRHRPAGSSKPEILHTLNGTAVAVGRTLIAMLENGQQEDGSVALPEVLPRLRRAGLAAARRGLNQRQRRLELGVDVEGRVEPRDLEEAQNRRVRADDRHLTARVGDLPQRAQQDAQAGRVDEHHVGEVQHERRAAAVDGRAEHCAELRSCADVDLALDGDDRRPVVDGTLLDPELGLGEGHDLRLPSSFSTHPVNLGVKQPRPRWLARGLGAIASAQRPKISNRDEAKIPRAWKFVQSQSGKFREVVQKLTRTRSEWAAVAPVSSCRELAK